MNFTIITFGCKVNSYESNYMREILEKDGFKWNDDFKSSDIVLVNTCSVTNTADNKCRKMIRSIRRENPNGILLVCGCSSENHREEFNNLGIDILLGNRDKSKVNELIKEFVVKREKYVDFYQGKNNTFEDMRIHDFNLTRAFVKIQDGCNNYCTYCIIPYVRGNMRSKNFTEVVEEVRDLVNNGHKEIVFTGINTGAYGRETKKYDIVDLIREVSKIDGLLRIRISSIELTELDDKFIQEMKNNNKLCGHLHVSLQSGSEKMLKLMNRKYTPNEFLEKINKLRKVRKDINITTDVIVGFPGETVEDFNECVEFCKKVGFSKIHVFPYSRREGTKAALMKDQLPNAIKKERARKLIEIDKDLQDRYYRKFIGKIVKVLVEENEEEKAIGHTDNYLKVVFDGKVTLNEVYNVLVTGVDGEMVKGDLV